MLAKLSLVALGAFNMRNPAIVSRRCLPGTVSGTESGSLKPLGTDFDPAPATSAARRGTLWLVGFPIAKLGLEMWALELSL